MTDQNAKMWGGGDAYDYFMGRWSRLLARGFLTWLAPAAGLRWLDVGCGTGALTAAILAHAAPKFVSGIDPAAAQVASARDQLIDNRAEFLVGDILSWPFEALTVDRVVSGLVLNFMPDAAAALSAMRRITKPDGMIAAYVWDYGGKMEFLRYFWDAVSALDAAAAQSDEGLRFPLCQPQPLRELFDHGGLDDVDVQPIDIVTHFADFDDYWLPFLGGRGPAGAYALSIDEQQRAILREHIRGMLPIAADGSITLTARAWAVRGFRRRWVKNF